MEHSRLGGLEAVRLGCWLGFEGMPNGRLEIEGGLEECYRKSHTLDAQERSADFWPATFVFVFVFLTN